MQFLKKCLLVLCALALLLTAVSCKKDDQPEDDGLTRGEHADDVVYATANYRLTVAMMSYLLYSEYHNFCNYYGGYLPYIKEEGGTALDTTKPLRDQIYSSVTDSVTGQTASVTWFDFFANYAKQNAEQILVYCEAAKASGLALDEADRQRVTDYIKEVETYAASQNMTVTAYLQKNFGADVTLEEVRIISEYSILASKQSELVAGGIAENITNETLDSLYESNKAAYDTGVDFLIVAFNVSYAPKTAEEVPDALATYEATQQAYRSRMDALAALRGDRAAFEELLLSYLREDAVALGKEDPDAVAEASLKASLMTDYTRPSTDNALSTWLFAEGRAVGDTNTFVTEAGARDAESNNMKKVSSSYTACFFVQGLHRNETRTRNVGHILFTTDSFKNLTTTTTLIGEIKALAETLVVAGKAISAENMSKALLEKMQAEGVITTCTDENGDTYYTISRESFENYGERFTQDGNVFYNDVYVGQMVAEFENWLFDENRHENEISFAGAVETSYGFHIMYYGGEGEETWRIAARADAEESLYEAWYETALGNTGITETKPLWDYVAVQ